MFSTWILMRDWVMVQQEQTPAEARRKFVLRALRTRFHSGADPDVANRVLAEEDPAVLRLWVDRAMFLPSLQAIRDVILPPTKRKG
jgi:hypothetical protein